MQASCRYLSFVQVRDRRARAQLVQALLSAGHVKPTWTDPWWVEHLAVEEVLDQRDVVQCELADEEDIEAADLCKGFEDSRDPPEVDRVLHGTAPDDDPDGDGPSGSRRYLMFCPERLEDLQESGAVEH